MATKIEEKTAADKLTAARNKNLDLAIQQIAKDYGEGAIMRLGGERIVDIDVIPTGNILIDRALGVGGFPRGRIVEIFGPESSGKQRLRLPSLLKRKNAAALQRLSMSSTRWILPTQKDWASILTIYSSHNRARVRKLCEYARRSCAPTHWT